MPSDEPCPGSEAPGLLSSQAARAFARRMDQELRPHGISFAQLTHLMLLEREGPMLQRGLVEGSSIGQPAMVAALRKLEAAGLVTRSPSPSDRRVSIVTLTGAARSLIASVKPLFGQTNARALSGFSGEERRTLAVLLGRVVANLGGDG